MKPLFTILLIIASFSVFGQDCSPASGVMFQQKFNSIAQQKDDNLKLIVSKDFVSKYCLTSDQVKTIALLFKDDTYRLSFCKEASVHTLDMNNFYDVYDAFSSFSNAFRLHDYIKEGKMKIDAPAPPPVTSKPVKVTFPAIRYPSYVSYTGTKGCDGPVLAESKFIPIAQNVFKQPTDESKAMAISNAVNDNCLSFAMSMKLTSLISNDAIRLKTLKDVFPGIYDMENYGAGTGLFSTYKYQQAWTEFAKQTLTPKEPAKPDMSSCAVSDEDFVGIMNSLRREYFSRDKMVVVESMVKSRCFSVLQVKTLMGEFVSGKDALEVAKMCYGRCTNQKDYSQVVDALRFSMDKAELRNFIANNSN